MLCIPWEPNAQKGAIMTFFVTQDREESTDSVERATVQEALIQSNDHNNSLSPFVKQTFKFYSESVVVLNFVHASPPQPSTAVQACGD